MLPARPAPGTRSGAERRLFDRIREELGDEWIVLHSLGLTVHDRKPWAEVDFVLIGPTGVYCLEVKGGLLTREEGVWYTTPQGGDDAGLRSRLKESPFEQAGSAAAQLFAWLESRVPEIARSVTGYAVAAPDVEWTISGPDVDRALVYDQVDSLRGFADFMDRVSRRWNERVGRGWGRDLEPLGRRAKQGVVDAIRTDFALVPSLHATAETAGRELIRLTKEQTELFSRLAGNQKVVARGGAGTGKTVLAAAEARRLAAEGRSVLLTCFNRNLAAFVDHSLQDVPEITVAPLHALMQSVIDEAGRQDRVPDVDDADRFQVFIPEVCLEVLLDESGRFDAIVVDEGQDLLLEPYVDVVDALLTGGLTAGTWRWFLDADQNVFTGVAAAGMTRLLDQGPVDWPLTVNCRNTSPIATQVALLTDGPLTTTLAPEGPDVGYVWWEEADGQRTAVWRRIGELLKDGFEPEQVTVLSPHRLQNSSMGAEGGGDALTDLSRGGWTPDAEGVRFSTIASFKGLESDVVLLVDIDDLETDTRPLLYVGASRARLVLEVFLAESTRDSFKALAKRFGGRAAAQSSS